MKKARILLTALTVLTVVAGALAFKPAKFAPANVFCSVNSGFNRCPIQTVTTIDVDQDTAPLPCSPAYTATFTTIPAGTTQTYTYCVATATTNQVFVTAAGR